MRTFRLAMVQMNPTVGDLEGNTAKILQYIDDARSLGADLAAFPELAICGYPPEDLLFKPQFIRDNRRYLDQVVAASKGIAVVVGFPHADGDLYNAAAVAYDGKLVDIYHKMYLPTYGVFDEDRYFRAGRRCPVYVINGVGVGVNICEDIWYAMGPTAVQRDAGAELIVNINGSPYYSGKGSFRERMVAARAQDNQLFVSYANMVGGQDELVFDGGSMVFDHRGELVMRGPQFQEALVVADLDVEPVFSARLHDPRPRKENQETLQQIGTPVKIHVSDYQDGGTRPALPKQEWQTLEPLAEVYSALVMGTRDYIRKSGFQKVLLGLSGGIDSSFTVTVAVDALGKENVVGVAMPSRYSSEGSILHARQVADSLGIELRTIPIEPAHQAYLDVLEPSFRGTQPGVAEENIQARIRGNILMALSNKLGWLVLSTGNKSELSVGYSTLYGDMAGGFAVLKDVPKTLVYRLAEWRNAHGTPRNVIPEEVLNKPPSPELRANQMTEEERIPYRLMDPILKAYVEDDRTFDEMVDMGFDPAQVKQVIQWVDSNEYKRRQSPPGVKITPRNFGRDRRMPIVNRYKHF
ncbi:MAG: NAD+ synthase [Dehalococcoidia bacterium]|nr:NAD+ synthase [Dehalococcoidia bacterium]